MSWQQNGRQCFYLGGPMLQDEGRRCGIGIHGRIRSCEKLSARSEDVFKLAESRFHGLFQTLDILSDTMFDGRLPSEKVSKSIEGSQISTWRFGVSLVPGSR
jgi:hypothetical protein